MTGLARSTSEPRLDRLVFDGEVEPMESLPDADGGREAWTWLAAATALEVCSSWYMGMADGRRSCGVSKLCRLS